MQAIKNLVSGRTDETQSGREPASGQTGAGTTSEPYDAGNTTGDSSLGGSAPSESTYGSSNTDVGSTFGDSTSGSGNTDAGGAENTFARDRGGPSAGNKGPHTISIANKLDPNVDSDGDGKPRSGPNDLEHAVVGGLSTTSGQVGSTGGYSSDITGSTPNYGSTSSYSNNTGNRSGEIAGEAPIGGYSSSAQGRNTSSYDNPTSSTSGTHSSTSTNDALANDRTSTQQTSSTTLGSGAQNSNTSGPSSTNYSGQDDLSRSTGINVTSGIHPEHQTDQTGVPSTHSHVPKFSDQRPTSSNQSSVPAHGQARAPIGGFGAVEPSAAADFTSGNPDSHKDQGGDRPLEEPSGHQIAAVRAEKETTERQQAGGQTSEGTGELWVKSTGMAADGGDFDAARPGAGREADRLMEQKGIHRDP